MDNKGILVHEAPNRQQTKILLCALFLIYKFKIAT
jgi:hypothetical protein